MWVLYLILAIVVIFLSIIIIRALMFNPKPQPKIDETTETFDSDRAADNLCQLIRFKTVSYRDHSLEDDAEFEKLIEALPSLYPNVAKVCEFKRFPDKGILYHWKGKNNGNPSVMMAHFDVVPVNEEGWTFPAFEGIIKDGYICGRGSLDTKVTMNGILFAADHLIAEGFVPENDMYFAFSGGEEINEDGALHIVNYFDENNIEPSFVLDEGGAVVENVFPGVKDSVGLIGIAEKGLMNVQYTVKSGGGHASAPKPNAPVDRLCKACNNVLAKPFKIKLTPPVALMFDTLGRYSSFVYKVIFANVKIFMPILNMMCKKSGGDLNALLRTTVAFTQMNGSSAPNVIPPEASLVSNIRLNPADTMDSALEYFKKVIDDENVEVSCINGVNPSRISQVGIDVWDKLASSVASTWKGTIVSPYLMMQCSDSRHYGKISDKVYRFSAMDLTAEERATIHGHDEKLRIETNNRTVEFYIRLMRKF
ncbi:MAG: M20/M25/M40 family metallo-hydrolase [Clostridia bacterium]|nr:M20/M25/M40 family metallo-hydrolase [Clostridia bacterium]